MDSADAMKFNNKISKDTHNMYLESERGKSFKDWPFKDHCLCTAEMVSDLLYQKSVFTD